MAGASDKARFYLEQSIPELKECERKKIFSPDEIAAITRKRSEFEHKLNARECQPSDYARYTEFEINVDSLKRKRVKRLRIKTPTYVGQRKVFLILERATRRFPGDIGLWMQQIEFARQQKAYKKLSHILTKALRLHPSKPELWVYAGKIAMEDQADMIEARSYMQKGLRFCKGSKLLWLEYAKLELLYMAKLTLRWRILGIDELPESQRPRKSLVDTDDDLANHERRQVEDVQLTQAIVDEGPAPKLANASLRSGAIPIAIFDAAMIHCGHDEKLAQEFFETVQNMESIPCAHSIVEHIVDYMLRSEQRSWRTVLCNVKLSCVGIAPTSPELPKALRESLQKLQAAPTEARQSTGFLDGMHAWLGTYLKNDSVDGALHQIMVSTLKQLQVAAGSSHAGIDVGNSSSLA